MKQKTIKQIFTLTGIGLHTGCEVTLVFKPAPENSGINFSRIDLPEKPIIKADPSNILKDSKIPRCTSIGSNGATIHTVEHLMGALYGLGINNLFIEIDSEELPGLDGSSIDFFNAVKEAGIEDQGADTECFQIQEPIGVRNNDASICVFPSDEFKISYTLDYAHPNLGVQFFSSVVNAQTFEKDIASCRTFCLEDEADELRNQGLGKGANYDNTLVVGSNGVKENQLRFEDEFVRHKILDFIGDLYLLGMPIRGHVFATKSGHQLNLELLKNIHRQKERYESRGFIPNYDWGDKKEIDIHAIMDIIPHRYPFLLVDRVIEIEKGKKAIGVKNVTMNDGFFQGHFPQRPVMPGVLMIEAMAQTAGVAILSNEAHHGKVAFFMSVDKVKFRKVVIPGDQLIMEIEVIKDKARFVQVRARAKVDGSIVVEADMVFSYADASYLN